MQTADLCLSIRPISKARPRSFMGQSRPYTDKVYKEWLGQCRALMGEWWTNPPLTHINCLICHFHGPARGDLDNRLGSLLDAGNGLIWKDDNRTSAPLSLAPSSMPPHHRVWPATAPRTQSLAFEVKSVPSRSTFLAASIRMGLVQAVNSVAPWSAVARPTPPSFAKCSMLGSR